VGAVGSLRGLCEFGGCEGNRARRMDLGRAVSRAGFFGEPLFEDDWARYLWDGRQLIVSGNPYATAPVDHFADDNVPEPFRRLLDEINNPMRQRSTAPVCQFAFALSHLIAPAHLWPLKLLLLAADLLTLALLLGLSRGGMRCFTHGAHC
jgi:hypothetical protein